MGKARVDSRRYKYSLPLQSTDTLPPLVINSPISWCHWLFSYYRCLSSPKKIKVSLQGGTHLHILVTDLDDMIYLWDHGFFGTGQMSRSEPTWLKRTQDRLAPAEGDDKTNNISLEKITKIRRVQRNQFKKQREKMEAALLELRKQGCTMEEESEFLESQREELRSFKAKQMLITTQTLGNDEENRSTDTEYQLRLEDSDIIDSKGNVMNIEALELLPVEALFLTLAIPVLDITPAILLEKLCKNDSERLNLIKLYAAYHHYRSRGWCARSGIKFGCDYILYKRGPPFQHAEFCISVLDHDQSMDYTWYSSNSRVINSARKTFILCFMENTVPKLEILKHIKQQNIAKAVSCYKVNEIVYRRWLPGKNRD